MAEILLCCEMMEDEIKLALQRTDAKLPVEWVDAGLHEYPDKLREKLEQRISELEKDYDTILLGFCLCGNALVGIGSEKARLVAPRYDDCIRMLMCQCPGKLPDMDCHYMYFTDGWTSHGEFIAKAYQRTCDKFGEKKAKKIYKTMLKNYEGFCLVDTGAFDLEKGRQSVKGTAEMLDLGYTEAKGSIRILEKLLRREWDDEFYVLEPGEEFQQMEFLRHPE